MALKTKIGQDGIVLTEAQLKVLEKRKAKKEANGGTEAEHPGYLEAQEFIMLILLRILASYIPKLILIHIQK